MRGRLWMMMAGGLLALPAAAFDLAVTLDDLPWSGPAAGHAEAAEAVPRLIAAIRAADLPVTGFSVCATAAALPDLQAQWRAGGVEIANHSATHADYNRLSPAQWTAEVEDCQRALAAQGPAPQWFRFPQLHQGDTTAKRTHAQREMARLGLRNAPVSVDTSDWLVAEAYARLATPAQRERAGRLFVDHVLRSLRHARQVAAQRYRRDVAQVLLLHANRLNADHWPALVAALRAEGARFVSLPAALRDPVYALADDYSGPRGLSWLYRTAPATPELAAWDDAEAQRLRQALARIAAGDTSALDPAAPYALAGAVTLRHQGSDGRERVVHVWRPPATEGRVPVVVAQDGDYAFPLLQAIVRHYLDRGDIAPLAVVAISYPQADTDLAAYRQARSRDYTPTYTLEGGYGADYQRESGNAAQYRDVLLDELLPELARRESLDLDQATYVGHSYGGLFGAFLLATRPQGFRRYVLVSPSLWYDDAVIFRLAQQQRFSTVQAPQIYLAAGGLENPVMAADLRRYAQLLQAQGLPAAQLRAAVLDEETHNSIFPGAFTRALRWFNQVR